MRKLALFIHVTIKQWVMKLNQKEKVIGKRRSCLVGMGPAHGSATTTKRLKRDGAKANCDCKVQVPALAVGNLVAG